MKDPSPMEDDAFTTTVRNSIQALGRGFDVTSDIRLLYCKGAPTSRLIHLDQENTKDLLVSLSSSDDFLLPNVSVDIESSSGCSSTEATPVWSFHQVSPGAFLSDRKTLIK